MSPMTIAKKGIEMLILLIGGVIYAQMIHQMLEASLWFSNISEVEREISLRTEQGLYYSYYKALVKAPSLLKGLFLLIYDTTTEYPTTINVLQRMNLLPEVVLGVLYRIIQPTMPFIYFYIWNVFYLHAFLLVCLSSITWVLTQSWLGAVLTAIMYVGLRGETSRVYFAINLRENFAIPFLWLQVLLICLYLKSISSGSFPCYLGVSKKLYTKILRISHLFAGLLFCLCWQFNQFVSLLQSVVLLGIAITGLAPSHEICHLLLNNIGALLLTAVLQFGNSLIVCSLGLWFSVYSMAVIHLSRNFSRSSTFVRRCALILSQVVSALLLGVLTAKLVKLILHIEDDTHIFSFLAVKFGMTPSYDFDAQLYLCAGPFVRLPWSSIEELSVLGGFPLYAVTQVALLLTCIWSAMFPKVKSEPVENAHGKEAPRSKMRAEMDVLQPVEEMERVAISPSMAFFTLHCTIFGILALTTMRMKYLWTPQICVMCGCVLSHPYSAELLNKLASWMTSNSVKINMEESESMHLQKRLDGRKTSRENVKNSRKKVPLAFGDGQEIPQKSASYPLNLWQMSMTAILVVYIALWAHRTHSEYYKTVSHETEFYDPDTVELMKWIQNSTRPTDSFTGSMQLMAGVKLCTERPILNHPHYEDKVLREKTKELYHYYGRESPEFVWKILLKHKANYIIMEDSICLARREGCALPEIMDGHKRYHNKLNGLPAPDESVPYFCDEIRHIHSNQRHRFSVYFKLAMINRTFRVYKVLSKSSG